MRTLVIAYEYPWPARSGSRLRLLTTLHALSRAGPTDLFSLVSRERTDFDEPDPSLGLQGVCRVPLQSGTSVLGSASRPLLPAAVSVRDRHLVSDALNRFATDTYDLVWYFDVRSWVLASPPRPTATVIDFDDLEHCKIRARLSLGTSHDASVRDDGRQRTVLDRFRRPPVRPFSRFEALRWARLYRSASSRAGRVVVCSALDAERARASGIKRVAIVPNAYPRPDAPVGRLQPGSPPVVMFHGTLRYPPNADGARWLVGGIAPILRSLVPDTRIRLVGLGNPDLLALHSPPDTTVVGPVPDIVTELRQADVIVVPVRYGSGTRVKIIEAFAHRIPVVSTTLGAEGLDVQDGRHLLLADTTEGLASACARLLTETDLRRRVTEAAYQRYLDAFERGVVEERVVVVAQSAVAEGAVPAP
jgi:glycosyltransferase involved in cell wall biosynthesis